MNMELGIKVCLLAGVSAGFLSAEVKPHPLFTDGAVLQQGQTVPVWGTADEGEKVSVKIAGQTVSATAVGGKWKVELAAMKAGGPHEMTISGSNTIEVKNVLVGEVWVASGQSNMEWKLKQTDETPEQVAKAKYPEIRMFTVRRTTSAVPLTEAVGSWIVCSPETVGEFSAVGYHFARALHEKIKMPVGVVHTSWGGTPAQAWTSVEGFEGHAELAGYAKQAKEAAEKFAVVPPEKPLGSGQASVLYNGMLAPVIPYRMRGVIWYQGESNAQKSKEYQTLFPAMIADWRGKWKQGDFPFLYVQIAPFKGQPPEIREAQLLTLGKTKNVAMVVTTDVGNAEDIHPKQKRPVGERLALAARALVYGEKIVYSGPLMNGFSFKGDKAIVSFEHVGGGLEAKGGELRGFTIAGEDKNFVPATAEIVGDKVMVIAEGVSKPVAVRYGWENVPNVNLFNKEGLPASPFRTDVE